MAILYRPFKKLETESIKPLENGESYHSLIDGAVVKCEKAFSKLEEYLHYDKISFWELSADVLNANKSFLKLKYYTEHSTNCTLENLDYGKYIENNLEKLKEKVSLYNMLESDFGKIMTCVGITSIVELVTFYSLYATQSLNTAIIVCSFSSVIVGGTTWGITDGYRKNIITHIIQRSHHAPIENIAKYSEQFFYDLRKKIKIS